MELQIKSITTLLKYTYGLVPIVAGLDKYVNMLTDWSQYVSLNFANTLPFSAGTLMAVVGIIEIGAGILVLFKPKIGAPIVAIWLLVIALTLILGGGYFDVAVRDIVMAVGAYSLYKLSALSFHNNQ